METQTWSCSGSDELKYGISEMVLKKEKEVWDYKPYGNIPPTSGQALRAGGFLIQIGLAGGGPQ